MLSLTFSITKSGISRFYYFKFHLHSLFLLFTVMSLSVLRKRQMHNSLSHFCLVRSLQHLVCSLGRMLQRPLTANKPGTAHLVKKKPQLLKMQINANNSVGL